MRPDKKRKRQKEETESPKKKAKLSESPAPIGEKKTLKGKKKNKNLPSLNFGAISSPSNFEPREINIKFKPKKSKAKNEGASSATVEDSAQESFSILFANLNSNKSKKKKFNAKSPLKIGKASPLKQEVEVEQASTDVETFVSKKKKAKAKSPLRKEFGGSKLPSVKQAVEGSPKKFSNDKKSTEFKKKKVKVGSSPTVDSSKKVTDEKKVLNSEKPSKKKKKSKEFEDKNLDKTLFVGNLPADITRKGLEKLFGKFGPVVESVRLRGAIPVNIKISKKVAEIKHKFHESLHSRKGYVVFKTHEAAKTALSLNGTYVQGHHIIVDKASKSGEKKTYDNSRSIFVGNLPFDVDDEQMWAAFAGCGEVEAVRVIRDPETGAGKGFGYVLFTDKSGKQAALSQEKLEVEGRIVRIKAVEGNQRTPRKNNAQNFARRQAMKTKKTGDTPQSRKSSKKLIKKHQAEKQKKHIAQAFKKFL